METMLLLLLLLPALLLCGEGFSQGQSASISGTKASREIKLHVQTSADDIDGLKALADRFPSLDSSSQLGDDPCGGSVFYSWTWIECRYTNPPRVTAINLAGNSLKGELPEFSQMQALETIDFSNNMLSGVIPSFIGQLPNLTQLDLRNNQLSGTIPRSIVDNKKLTYYVDENSELHQPKKKKNLGLLIGLPFGLFLGLLLPGLVFFLVTRRKTPAPVQFVTGEVLVKIENNGYSQGIPHEKMDHPLPSPSGHGFDPVEMNELLQLHNSKPTRG